MLAVQPLQFRLAVVKEGVVYAPELWVLQRKAQGCRLGFSRQERDRSADLCIANPVTQTKRLLSFLSVDQGGFNPQRRRFLVCFRHRSSHTSR